MKINLLSNRLFVTRMTEEISPGGIVIPDTSRKKHINLSRHNEIACTGNCTMEFIVIDPVDIDKNALHQITAESPDSRITKSDVLLGVAAGSYKGSIASIGLIARGVSPIIGGVSFLFQLGDTMLSITGKPITNKIVLSNWHNPDKKVSALTAYIRNMSMDGMTMALAGSIVPVAKGALSLTSTKGFLEFIPFIISNQYLNSLFLTTQQKKEESKKLTRVGARWGLFYKMLITQPAVLAKLFHLGSISAVRVAFPGIILKSSLIASIPAIPVFIISLDLWTALIFTTYLTMTAWTYFFPESMNRIGASSQKKLDKLMERKVEKVEIYGPLINSSPNGLVLNIATIDPSPKASFTLKGNIVTNLFKKIHFHQNQ